MGRKCVLGILVVMLAAMISAQQKQTTFDVATIRPTSAGSRIAVRVLPNRAEVIGHDLRSLVMLAFGKQVYELSAPDWLIDGARFTIQATYPAGSTAKEFPEMLKALLVTRFGLVTHIEPRRMDAYDLVVSTGGIKMEEVDAVDDLEKDFSKSGPRISKEYLSDTVDGPSRIMAGEFGIRFVSARSLYESRPTIRRTTEIDATRITIPEFVGILWVNLDKPIIDRTGLTGLYRFKVELDTSRALARTVMEPTGADTFKAVESLGLKLEDRREPIDVLVVDKIERAPTEN